MELGSDSTNRYLAGNSCAVTCDIGTRRISSNHSRKTVSSQFEFFLVKFIMNYNRSYPPPHHQSFMFSYKSINRPVNEIHLEVKTCAEKRLAFLRARSLIESFSSKLKDNASANLAAYSLASDA